MSLDLIGASPDVVWEIDLQENLLHKPQSGPVLGYTPEELIGKSFSSFVHPDSLQAIRKQFASKSQKGEFLTLDVPAVHR